MKCFISAMRRPRPLLVEFQFALGDRDLGLDMVLPLAAFESFCRDRGIDPATGGEGWQRDGSNGPPAGD